MATVIVKNLNSRKTPTAKLKRRFVSIGGRRQTIYIIDTDRPDVGDQLRAVFQLNVNRALRRARESQPRLPAQ